MTADRQSIAAPFRVICAEDDMAVSIVLKCALQNEGFHVECLSDGLAALARILEDLPFFNLVVTDNNMPDMSGLALVRKLRESGFPGRIIVHSSQLSPDELACYRELAVDEILTKPITLPELLSAIHRFVP